MQFVLIKAMDYCIIHRAPAQRTTRGNFGLLQVVLINSINCNAANVVGNRKREAESSKLHLETSVTCCLCHRNSFDLSLVRWPSAGRQKDVKLVAIWSKKKKKKPARNEKGRKEKKKTYSQVVTKFLLENKREVAEDTCKSQAGEEASFFFSLW